MNSLRVLILLGALAPGLAAAGRAAPLATPAPFAPPAGLELTAVTSAIKQGVGECSWQVSFERRGYVEATLERRSMLIRVGLLHDAQQVRMVYLDNRGYHYHLEEDGTASVHKNLNVMLDRLDHCLHKALGVATTVPAEAPTEAEPAESGEASEPK